VKPTGVRLSELLGAPVLQLPDCIGDEVSDKCWRMEVILSVTFDKPTTHNTMHSFVMYH
jgi:hypothetical protein